MSRIGKKIIEIPNGTEIEWDFDSVTVKGPNGTIRKKLALTGFKLIFKKESLEVVPLKAINKKSHSLWGTLRSVINNMILGVNKLFEKVLEFEGVGYRAEVSEGELVLNLGYSHPIKLKIPEGINVSTGKNQIRVSGIDKELVGLFSAKIRKAREVEPYKGRGIKYQGEVIKRKAGKKMAGAV
jgi:large subunit ribosomal protein L6